MAADTRHARRAFLSRLKAGVTAAGLTVLYDRPAAAQQSPAPSGWQPRRHTEDDWLDQIPGVHRLVFDTTTPAGFSEALLFANNYLTANGTYGLTDAELAVVIVARHSSTPFAYTDAMWAKHGVMLSQRTGFVDPATKQPPTVNVHRERIDGVTKRGVRLAVCQMATRNQAVMIAKATGTETDAVYNELAANIVSHARMVPAGIVAVNRAQERGYSFAVAG